MDETTTARIDELEAERRSWLQVLEQTEEHLTTYAEGWSTTEAYAEVGLLRDRCREEIWEIDCQIAEATGGEPPEKPERAAAPTPERVDDAEDAVADLSEVTSETVTTVEDYGDALAELSEIVSELKGGE